MNYQEKDAMWRNDAIAGGAAMLGDQQQYAGNALGALKQADKARMDVALDELEGVLNQLNESARHLCSRIQRVSRPDLSTGVAEQAPKAIRQPSGPILENLEGLTEKARKITHHLQDTLNRLEV